MFWLQGLSRTTVSRARAKGETSVRCCVAQVTDPAPDPLVHRYKNYLQVLAISLPSDDSFVSVLRACHQCFLFALGLGTFRSSHQVSQSY